MDAKELFTGMTDEVLLETANAAFEVAKERGLELPLAAGILTVEQEVELQTPAETTADTADLTKESLLEQLGTAHKGYEATINALNAGKHKNKLEVASEETVQKEFEAWFSDDKLKGAKSLMELDPNTKFTVVATPNIEVDADGITKIGTAFGRNQPYPTYVYEPIRKKYTAAQLSGTNPSNGNAVQFSLIPHTAAPAALYGTVVQQRAKLTEMRKENPELKVPSELDAVTFWNTLKVAGEFDNGYDWRNTVIRGFNLPEQRIGDWPGVPDSFAYVDGGPTLYRSFAENDFHSRVSVG